MNVNIAGQHLSLTPALRTYVSEKLSRLERHFGQLIGANVILSVEKTRHKAEATIHTRGANLHAEAIDNDMYAAIDSLADKLDSQTRKFKEKTKDHHAKEVHKGQPS
ncbi:MAG TPA: ribosome-associated translation inhibitor RaiA [Verrucomicrobiae bacterium]|nr:ribosome-associated translation inhibitor RaiA [Verrucomicrobiae bacterium]